MAGGEQAIRTLLHGLLESGLAMAHVGSSRPASGCEHHASHFWDLLADRGRRAHHRHGLQVGYATRLAMQVQRFAFGGGVHELQVPVAPVDPLGPQARAWLGRPTPDIVEAVMQKQQFVEARRDRWPSGRNAWRSVCERLAPALGVFERVELALDAAGIPRRPEELDLDEATVRATFRHATRLRGRYTTVDFLEGQARLEDALGALVPAG